MSVSFFFVMNESVIRDRKSGILCGTRYERMALSF